MVASRLQHLPPPQARTTAGRTSWCKTAAARTFSPTIAGRFGMQTIPRMARKRVRHRRPRFAAHLAPVLAASTTSPRTTRQNPVSLVLLLPLLSWVSLSRRCKGGSAARRCPVTGASPWRRRHSDSATQRCRARGQPSHILHLEHLLTPSFAQQLVYVHRSATFSPSLTLAPRSASTTPPSLRRGLSEILFACIRPPACRWAR